MNVMATGARRDSDLAKNYAFILAGAILLPLMVVAHFRARRKRGSTADPAQSHYEMQYRTTSLTLICLLALFLSLVVLLVSMPRGAPIQQARLQMGLILLSNIAYPLMLWATCRSVRGLYLSAAGQALQKPRSLWVWPT